MFSQRKHHQSVNLKLFSEKISEIVSLIIFVYEFLYNDFCNSCNEGKVVAEKEELF